MFKNLSKSIPYFREWVFLSAFLFVSLQAFSQNVTVKGTVTAATDKTGLPGVNIVVKNTVVGTSTDADGKFELSVPSDAILVFSGIGYVTQESPLKGRSVVDVQLAADTKQLDELVVVGYGTQKKKQPDQFCFNHYRRRSSAQTCFQCSAIFSGINAGCCSE